MTRKTLLALVLAGIMAGAFAATELPTPQADKYVVMVATVKAKPGRTSLEPLYKQSLAAQKEIDTLMDKAPWKAKWNSEGGFEPYFKPYRDKMPLYSISQYEGDAIVDKADFGAFGKLAARHGLPADQTFFKLSQAFYGSGSIFPAFVEQTWDYGGCNRYGAGVITPQMKQWRTFKKQHPKAYTPQVADSLKQFKDVLLPTVGPEDPICSCNGKAGYLKELRAFKLNFPHDALAPAIGKRLRQAQQTGKGAIKFESHYG